MAYKHKNSKGVEYYLNTQDVTLKGGRVQPIYFFSRDERPKTTLDDLPEGKIVVESPRTGLPIIKNAKVA